MKIIQIVGPFKRWKDHVHKDLIPALSAHGNVGVVKHLGHHGFMLEPGKDTTIFYESHAAISSGVDNDKSVIIRRENDLDSTLEVLCNAGIDYANTRGVQIQAVPEGSNRRPRGRERRPPEPLHRRCDRRASRVRGNYYTVEGLVRELKREYGVSHAGAVLTFNGIVREWTGTERTEYLEFDETVDALTENLRREIESVPGIIGARFHHRKGRLYAGEDITYVAILAEHREEAFAAASRAIDRLKRETA